MASNAEYYVNSNLTGAVALYRAGIQASREEAALTNKSRSDRRSELEKVLNDIESSIQSAQTALERSQTVDFQAHMKARTDRAKARAAASRGRGGAAKGLETLRVKARETMARSIEEAAKLSDANPDLDFDKSTAFKTVTRQATMAAFLGKAGIVPGGDIDSGQVTADQRDAISLGFAEGYTSGLASHGIKDATSTEIDDSVRGITGVNADEGSFNAIKGAAGNRVVSTATASAGSRGISDADVDAALEHSGLAESMGTRMADMADLEAQRAEVLAQVGSLPGQLGEDDILRQAASRMGPVGEGAGGPTNLIADHMAMKRSRDRLAEEDAARSVRDTQRAAIESMSPAQRILMQSTINGMDLNQRHPGYLGRGEFSQEVLDAGGEITNAMRNDPSLRGNPKAIVELAAHLATPPSGSGKTMSADQIRARRDQILMISSFNGIREGQNTEFVPEVDAEIDEVELKRPSLEDIEFLQRPRKADISVEDSPDSDPTAREMARLERALSRPRSPAEIGFLQQPVSPADIGFLQKPNLADIQVDSGDVASRATMTDEEIDAMFSQMLKGI